MYIQASGDEGIRELEIARGIRTREETISCTNSATAKVLLGLWGDKQA
ncbi:MAG: hypothetical protein M3243_07000 [Thermoproteota archaeon]|nr:hypothetical protein [Thermoproteota archaeon]